MLKKIKRKIKSIIRPQIKASSDNIKLENGLEAILLQNGRIWEELISRKKKIESFMEIEFKVFSQWGDDGIIQFLVNHLDIRNKTFVEFGVEDYSESNTRFLLMNNNWSGLIIDGSESHVSKIQRSNYYWQHDLKAKSAFITAENINQLIGEEGISGEIGLLHIDIDGNDYWVWKALNIIEPIIMIVEYNAVFGMEKPITIPYSPEFIRTRAHHSNLYFGSSLTSLFDLARERGYDFVGCNTAGNNAYFIKKEFLNGLKPLTIDEGFMESKFRESRDQNGNLNYVRGKARLESLKGMPVYNTRLKKMEKL